MSAVYAVVLAIIAILAGVGVFAIQKMKPGWFRIQAGVWRLLTFSMEVGQPGVPASRDKPRELEAGREPRELEAGPTEPSAADQDNAAAL